MHVGCTGCVLLCLCPNLFLVVFLPLSCVKVVLNFVCNLKRLPVAFWIWTATRRIEDKLDAKGLNSQAVYLRFDKPPSSKKVALSYQAWIVTASGPCRFTDSMLYQDRPRMSKNGGGGVIRVLCWWLIMAMSTWFSNRIRINIYQIFYCTSIQYRSASGKGLQCLLSDLQGYSRLAGLGTRDAVPCSYNTEQPSSRLWGHEAWSCTWFGSGTHALSTRYPHDIYFRI